MLFQRLYNWIKYKTLPPSFLFKNRLFIERDSKHRRVLSNFGLTYRNSKWSNYQTYNIKTQFKNNYMKFFFHIFFIVFSALVFFNFDKYYIMSYCFNSFSFFFWIGLDTFDYYISFLIWFGTIIFSMFLNLIYSYLFFNNFSDTSKNEKVFSNNFSGQINLKSNLRVNDKFVSKHDLSIVLYSWLSNKNHSYSKKTLENLFNTNNDSRKWNDTHDYFTNVYKLSFFLKMINTNHTDLKKYLTAVENINLSGYSPRFDFLFDKVNCTADYFSLITSCYFNSSKKKIFQNLPNQSLTLLNSRFESNLYYFNSELKKNSFLLKNKIGLFFFSDLNNSRMSYLLNHFEEFWILNHYLKNQLTLSKWNRWLYRYSILHRKILKNSHKITLTKKLISPGLADSKFFDKNIWNNQFTNKYSSSLGFASLNSLLFEKNYNYGFNGLNSNKSSINVSNLLSNKIELFNFHENSYFWFLKRFYLLNNLNTNFIMSKSKALIEKETHFLSNNNSNKRFIYDQFYNFFLKSSFLTNNQLAVSLTYGFSNNDHKSLVDQPNITNFLIKDLSLNLNELELFSKDNLKPLLWFTSNLSVNNNLVFLDYLFSSSENYYLFTNFSNKLVIDYKPEFNDFLILLFLTNDNSYLTDLYYFTFFS